MALTFTLNALDQRLNAFLQSDDAVEKDGERSSLEDIFNKAQQAKLLDNKWVADFYTQQNVEECLSQIGKKSVLHRVLVVFLDALLRCELPPIVRKDMITSIHNDLLHIEPEQDPSRKYDGYDTNLIRHCVSEFLRYASIELAWPIYSLPPQIHNLLQVVMNALFTNAFPDLKSEFSDMLELIENLSPDSTMGNELQEAIKLCDPVSAEINDLGFNRAMGRGGWGK
jgi:hypothetical protein